MPKLSAKRAEYQAVLENGRATPCRIEVPRRKRLLLPLLQPVNVKTSSSPSSRQRPALPENRSRVDVTARYRILSAQKHGGPPCLPLLWHNIPLDEHEKPHVVKKPLLPFLEKINGGMLPERWDNRLKPFIRNDDSLLWDLAPDRRMKG